MDNARQSLVRIVALYDQFVKRLDPDQIRTPEGRNMQRLIADIRDEFTPDMNVQYVHLRGKLVNSDHGQANS